MAKRIVYYDDALRDDFAGTNINTQQVPADFPFVLKGPVWAVLGFLVYRLLATPLVFLIGKLGYGLRIKNRRALRPLRKTGFFLYGNHTQPMMDAYTPTLCVFPHRAHIVANPDAVSIPGIRRLVQLLGAIPLPGTLKGMPPFLDALTLRISQRRVVAIYPEAHVWPWYTGIRPFPDGSFAYPVRCGVPAVACVTTYRQRRIFKRLPPCMTVTLSDPLRPDPALPPRAARRQLRDAVYDFMARHAAQPDNVAYREYRQRPSASNP